MIAGNGWVTKIKKGMVEHGSMTMVTMPIELFLTWRTQTPSRSVRLLAQAIQAFYFTLATIHRVATQDICSLGRTLITWLTKLPKDVRLIFLAQKGQDANCQCLKRRKFDKKGRKASLLKSLQSNMESVCLLSKRFWQVNRTFQRNSYA